VTGVERGDAAEKRSGAFVARSPVYRGVPGSDVRCRESRGSSPGWNISRFAQRRRGGQTHCNSDRVITCAAAEDILPAMRARCVARAMCSREKI